MGRWSRDEVYEGIETLIITIVVLVGIGFFLAGMWWAFFSYCFLIWCSWKAVKWFEREWCDVDLPRKNDFGSYENKYASSKRDDLIDQYGDYNPYSHYDNQVRDAKKPGSDEDPDVIKLRAKIKRHMKQQRKRNEKELDLEDNYRAHQFPRGW